MHALDREFIHDRSSSRQVYSVLHDMMIDVLIIPYHDMFNHVRMYMELAKILPAAANRLDDLSACKPIRRTSYSIIQVRHDLINWLG